VIPFFAYPAEIRKIIYTTNAIESLHIQLRKVLKTRGHFPSDESLAVTNQLLGPLQITLVDDVLTMGRTAFACALRLHEAFPGAEIRIFAMKSHVKL
jgi:predicted amidophosphoribosyltransferase